MQASASSYEYLTNEACIKNYYQDYISGRRNLIIVTDADSGNAPNSSVLEYSWDHGGKSWLCSAANGLMGSLPLNKLCPDTGPDPNDWNVVDKNGTLHQVKYCKSEVIPARCQLQFSLTISNVVVICNLLKFLCMAIVACKVSPATICTLG